MIKFFYLAFCRITVYRTYLYVLCLPNVVCYSLKTKRGQLERKKGGTKIHAPLTVHPSPPPGKKSLGAGGGSKFYMQIKLISVYLICSMPPAPSCCVSSQLGYFYVLFMIDIFSRITAVLLLSQCLVISYFLEEVSDHLCISNFLK